VRTAVDSNPVAGSDGGSEAASRAAIRLSTGSETRRCIFRDDVDAAAPRRRTVVPAISVRATRIRIRVFNLCNPRNPRIIFRRGEPSKPYAVFSGVLLDRQFRGPGCRWRAEDGIDECRGQRRHTGFTESAEAGHRIG